MPSDFMDLTTPSLQGKLPRRSCRRARWGGEPLMHPDRP
jgi:hypothetical protein